MIINPLQTQVGTVAPQGFNPQGYMRPQAPMNGGMAGIYQGAQPPTGGLNFSHMNTSQPTMAMPGANVHPAAPVAPPQTGGFVQGNANGGNGLQFSSKVTPQPYQMNPQMARIAALRGQM